MPGGQGGTCGCSTISQTQSTLKGPQATRKPQAVTAISWWVVVGRLTLASLKSIREMVRLVLTLATLRLRTPPSSSPMAILSSGSTCDKVFSQS